MNNQITGYEALQKVLNEYINFEVDGRVLKIPYVFQFSRGKHRYSSGKGTPEMIRRELLLISQKKQFDLKKATVHEIYDFMRRNRIGIECSGFAYHLLNAYVKAEKGLSLNHYLRLYPGLLGELEQILRGKRRYRNANAKTLTSKLNTIEIPLITEVRVADLIQMSIKRTADHVLIVTGLDYDADNNITQITYAHSSSVNTQKRGPHTADIKVIDSTKTISEQNWLEQSKDGQSYRTHFHPEKGDGIRRLKVLV